MIEVNVVREFSAAHNLRGYLGKCEELHGHNWKVKATLVGRKPDKSGMLMDFRQIKLKLNKVLDALDHKYLNRLDYFKKQNPTSENIAEYIYLKLKPRLPGLKSISVWESEDCSATHYGK